MGKMHLHGVIKKIKTTKEEKTAMYLGKERRRGMKLVAEEIGFYMGTPLGNREGRIYSGGSRNPLKDMLKRGWEMTAKHVYPSGRTARSVHEE